MTEADKPKSGHDATTPTGDGRHPADLGVGIPSRKPFWERRRDKIRDEVARNRRGEYTVPTWVLVVILVAVLAGWAAIIVFA